MTMATGTRSGRVKFWHEAKGYGFIADDEPGVPDTFLHFIVANFRPYIGARVTFQVGMRDGRTCAQKVREVQFNATHRATAEALFKAPGHGDAA